MNHDDLKPGLYFGEPIDEYLAWPALSNTNLGWLLKSPAHYQWNLQHPPEATEAMDLGNAIHACVLEPERFLRTYEAHVEGSRATKEVKGSMERIRERGKEPMRPSDYAMCLAIREQVHDHPAASFLLERAAYVEASGVYEERVADTRFLCKFRPDVICEAGSILVDLKSARDASPEGFKRAIAQYGYHRAAAHYLAGMGQLGHDYRRFAFIVVEKEPPYAVAVYNLDASSLAAGFEERYRMLVRYAECLEADSWPGYSEKIENVALPTWAEERSGQDPVALADLSSL